MKRSTKSLTVTVLLISLIAIGMLFAGGTSRSVPGPLKAVKAQESGRTEVLPRSVSRYCSIGTVAGSYAYSASGFVTQPIPQLQIPAGPFAVTSLLTLNLGTFSFRGTQSFNGNLVPAVGSGTYTVNDDCTGSAVDSSGIPYTFVIADGGHEIRIMLAVPNTANSGTAKRL